MVSGQILDALGMQQYKIRVVEISDDFENVADDDNPIDNKANKVTQSNQISFVLHDELPHEQSRCIQ